MKNIRRHLGILFILFCGCFLLLSEKTIPIYQTLAGMVCIVWALLLIRTAKGEEGFMEPFEKTNTYKELKK